MTVIKEVRNLYNAIFAFSRTNCRTTFFTILFLYRGLAHGRSLLVNTKCCELRVGYWDSCLLLEK